MADALNAALAAANNPQQTLDAFAGGLGTLAAIEFVPAEGFCTAAIRRIRLYNHDGSVPRQNNALGGESITVKPMLPRHAIRTINLRRIQ